MSCGVSAVASVVLMCVSAVWFAYVFLLSVQQGAGAAAALVSRGARRKAGRAQLKPAVLILQQVLVGSCCDILVWHGVL